VTGTILNVAGIVAGGVAGSLKKKPLATSSQLFFKATLGIATVFFGLRLTWISLSGPLLQILKQLGVVLVAMVLGRLTGRLLRLQKNSNRLGQFARERMAAIKPGEAGRFMDGFKVCAVLFCAAPLAMLGSVCEGLTWDGTGSLGYYYPLAIKAVMDGLAAMSFVSLFGWGSVWSAVPVLVFQGTVTLLCLRFLQPLLQTHHLIDPLNAAAGLLIFSVALLIFEIKRIEVTDYLPSLAYAPLLAWWLGWSPIA
jgi:uncharacterized membrane protein YqgA involved in biofilm formation